MSTNVLSDILIRIDNMPDDEEQPDPIEENRPKISVQDVYDIGRRMYEANHPVTLRCAHCDWTVTGISFEVLKLQVEHRKLHLVRSKPRGRYNVTAAKTARRRKPLEFGHTIKTDDPNFPHGTSPGYQGSTCRVPCRCDACRVAYREHVKNRKSRAVAS